jgi:hypothetical protein
MKAGRMARRHDRPIAPAPAANAGEAGMASLERVCAAVRACLGRAGAVS